MPVRLLEEMLEQTKLLDLGDEVIRKLRLLDIWNDRLFDFSLKEMPQLLSNLLNEGGSTFSSALKKDSR